MSSGNDDGNDYSTSFIDVRSLQEEFAKAHSPARAYFIVLSGNQIGLTFQLREDGETVIGRLSSCGLMLNDEGVSRRHARVFRDAEGEVVIEDIGSANGTLVNGEVAGRAVLRDGDKVTVGAATILKFTYADKIDETFQQKMQDAIIFDSLTKVHTRAHLLRQAEMEISYATRHKRDFVLLSLDVDRFKAINDTHGHAAGDLVLKELAGNIAKAVRREDTFGRVGGEEFAVLARGLTLQEGLLFAERLRRAVEGAPPAYREKTIPVTISIGVAHIPSCGAGTLIELLDAADRALYEAKRTGRNRVVAANASMSPPEPGEPPR